LRIRDIMAKGSELKALDALSIVSFALSMRKEEALTRLDAEIEDGAARRIERFFEERKAGKPLAYITGEKEFFSHPFLVDSRVLIPRPETELLVEEALAILAKRPDIRTVMDMGAGSGVIGNMVARISARNAVCVDISPDALAVAKKNGEDPAVSERLTFLCSDLFGGVTRRAKFDMILANLPYVAEDEWDEVMIDVKGYEPSLALLGGDDGLHIYRRFVSGLPEHLSRGGYALCEIGSRDQAEKMKDLMKSYGLEAAVKKDLADKERVIIGTWINL
jgi:release factor glutamine methyltransferase